MIYKIWASLEKQDESKDHYQDLDMPEQLGVFDTRAQAEKFLKLIVGFCDSFGSGIVTTAIPPNPQHGRESGKVKPLAQYLGEHIKYQHSTNIIFWNINDLVEDVEQALDAYQSTENVKIRIEPA